MFEKASRIKLRFDSCKGLLSTEDLWDLPLTGGSRLANLDDIARGLHKQLKSDDDISFVVKSRKSDVKTQLAFDIVKHIIEVRMAEDKVRQAAQENSAKKQRILQLIAEKKDEDLKGKSLDDLVAMVGELS